MTATVSIYYNKTRRDVFLVLYFGGYQYEKFKKKVCDGLYAVYECLSACTNEGMGKNSGIFSQRDSG